jgi:hypothetical protein
MIGAESRDPEGLSPGMLHQGILSKPSPAGLAWLDALSIVDVYRSASALVWQFLVKTP